MNVTYLCSSPTVPASLNFCQTYVALRLNDRLQFWVKPGYCCTTIAGYLGLHIWKSRLNSAGAQKSLLEKFFLQPAAGCYGENQQAGLVPQPADQLC